MKTIISISITRHRSENVHETMWWLTAKVFPPDEEKWIRGSSQCKMQRWGSAFQLKNNSRLNEQFFLAADMNAPIQITSPIVDHGSIFSEMCLFISTMDLLRLNKGTNKETKKTEWKTRVNWFNEGMRRSSKEMDEIISGTERMMKNLCWKDRTRQKRLMCSKRGRKNQRNWSAS